LTYLIYFSTEFAHLGNRSLTLVGDRDTLNLPLLVEGDGEMAMVAPSCETFRVDGVFLCAQLGPAVRPNDKEQDMTSNASQVIVVTEDHHRSLIHGLSAHHRDFPEVHAEASSRKAAATRLAELLSLTLENAPSDWRRQSIQQAIADVLAFAEEDD
jgi:hypothetical protein